MTFLRADLDGARLPLDDESVDVAAAVEVIEHLENPRAFVRELARITRPGGWVVVTTPNQLSALSLLTLLVKGRFSAFQERDYPAHRTGAARDRSAAHRRGVRAGGRRCLPIRAGAACR